MKKFSGAVFAIYRSALGLRFSDSQHVSVATACSLLGLLDHDSLLHIERLRYLRQLVRFGPDALWALLRQDHPYMDLLRGSLTWLYARVKATCDLPHPLESPLPWTELILQRAPRFKGLVQRAKGLELCRITCFAALQSLHSALAAHAQGEQICEPCEATPFTEACLVCRKAFTSRSAWAFHSSKLHGYRIAASVLAGSSGNTTCQGCGKRFSNAARLRRHLLHATSCRVGWGDFVPRDDRVPGPNPREPPLLLDGTFLPGAECLDPASYNKGLLDTLLAKSSWTTEEVWHTVVDFIEPLETLRRTVRLWADLATPAGSVGDILEDILGLLDPEVSCDTFHRTKATPPVATCCDTLPGPLQCSFPLVLTGAVARYQLEAPPCPAFCYPFIGGVPLSAAKRQTAYVEGACDLLGQLVQQSASTRVLLLAKREALACLEPAPSWLLSGGLSACEGGLESPRD